MSEDEIKIRQVDNVVKHYLDIWTKYYGGEILNNFYRYPNIKNEYEGEKIKAFNKIKHHVGNNPMSKEVQGLKHKPSDLIIELQNDLTKLTKILNDHGY